MNHMQALHTMLPHNVRNVFLLQLCCHSNVATLEKKNSICTKAIEPLNYFLVGQISILHMAFNNHKDEEDIYYFSMPTSHAHELKSMTGY
jgi:hypothetical protein